MYAHQQYFQKPELPQVSQQQQIRDIPDVPADSTSLVEQMMVNLRRATSSVNGQ
jgi:hypothetical protein